MSIANKGCLMQSISFDSVQMGIAVYKMGLWRGFGVTNFQVIKRVSGAGCLSRGTARGRCSSRTQETLLTSIMKARKSTLRNLSSEMMVQGKRRQPTICYDCVWG